MKTKWQSRIVGQGETDPRSIQSNKLNWRQHPQTQQRAMKGVLDEIGWVQQIIVNRRTGHLVDGHLRVEAARQHGEESVPVLYVDLDEAEEATVLATLDPLSALAVADEEILSKLLEKTRARGIEVEALLASVARGEGLRLGTPKPGLTGPDDPPPISRLAVTRTGDLWTLGKHRLLCGDSTSEKDLERVVGSDVVSWVWTDPPYGVEYTGKTSDLLKIQNDNPEQAVELIRSVFTCMNEFLADGAPLYIAHPSGRLGAMFAQAFMDAGWHLHQELIWVKDHMVMGRSDYHYRHEPIFYGWKGKNRPWTGGRTGSSVFEHPRPVRSVDHPSIKPVALIEEHLRNSSVRGSTGIDPFAGSGSTLMAAERSGRKCIAIEIDPRYVDVTVKRWQEYTGLEATLEGNDHTFDQTGAVRNGR